MYKDIETSKENKEFYHTQRNKLWKIIQSETDEKISLPLILAAWSETSDEEKLIRFKYHLQAAERVNATVEVERFLRTLNESDWHHKGE